MVINHNISALNTLNKLNANTSAASDALEKLSSGLRINKAADDAAGLAISQKMQAQINGLDQASSNAQDGISLIQTAEGSLNETQSILQRMNTLATQSANDTNTSTDRSAMQQEVNQLTQEIDRIGNTTQFNTKNLLDGSAAVQGKVTGYTNYADDYTILGGTGDTQVGAQVTFTGVVTATSANAVGADTYTSLSSTLTGDMNFTLDGVSFSFTSGSNTVQDVLDAVNNDNLGVKATLNSSNNIEFQSSNVGSAASFSFTTSDASFASYANGTDAQITGSGVSYLANGNDITIESGNAKGLSFEINSNISTSSMTSGNTITVNANGGLNLQIGANQGQTMYVSIGDMRAKALGVDGIDISTAANAESAITTLQNAINQVSTERSKLGAYQNRLDHTINNLSTQSQNLTSASSQITDVDMAKEMTEFTKDNILTQAAQSMLAQANQLPQGVLSLLK